MQKSTAEIDNEIHGLTSALESLTKDLCAAEKTATDASVEGGEVYNKAEKHVSNLRKQIASDRQRLDRLKIARHTAERTEIDAAIKAARAEIKRLESVNTPRSQELRREIERCQAIIKESQTKLLRIVEAGQSARRDLDSAVKHKTEFNAEAIREMTERVRFVNQRLNESMSALDTLRRRQANQQAMLTKAERASDAGAIERARAGLKSLAEKIVTVEAEKADIEQEVERANKQLKQLRE